MTNEHNLIETARCITAATNKAEVDKCLSDLGLDMGEAEVTHSEATEMASEPEAMTAASDPATTTETPQTAAVTGAGMLAAFGVERAGGAHQRLDTLEGRVDALERGGSMRPFQNVGWAVMAFLAFSIVGCIAGWMVTDRTAGIVVGTMTGAIVALVIGFGLESRAQKRAETDKNEA